MGGLFSISGGEGLGARGICFREIPAGPAGVGSKAMGRRPRSSPSSVSSEALEGLRPLYVLDGSVGPSAVRRSVKVWAFQPLNACGTHLVAPHPLQATRLSEDHSKTRLFAMLTVAGAAISGSEPLRTVPPTVFLCLAGTHWAATMARPFRQPKIHWLRRVLVAAPIWLSSSAVP